MFGKRVLPSLKKARIVAGMSEATEASGPPALGVPPRSPGSVWDIAGRASNRRHRGTTAFVQNFTTDLLAIGRKRQKATAEMSTMNRFNEWRRRSLRVPEEPVFAAFVTNTRNLGAN